MIKLNRNNITEVAQTLRDWISLSIFRTCSDLDERKSRIMASFDKWIGAPIDFLLGIGINKLGKDLKHHFLGMKFLVKIEKILKY